MTSSTPENEVEMLDVDSSSRGNASHVDEGLHHQQLHALDGDALKRMGEVDVLIAGAKGLSVEVARDLLQIGVVKSITLQDTGVIKLKDLSSQYLASTADIGNCRARTSAGRIQEFNRSVKVYSYSRRLTENFMKRFKVIILTSSTIRMQRQVGEFTRKNGIALIVADTKGLFGQVFCDFGDNFTVCDHSATTKIDFLPFKDAIAYPKFVITDIDKADRPRQLHLGFQGLDVFRKCNSRLPSRWNREDAQVLLSIVRKINEGNTDPIELDDDLICKLSYIAEGDLCPMQTVIGSIAAQECIKACSRKFYPIVQWFYFDALECLPEYEVDVEQMAEKTNEYESRYSKQIAVFGKDIQEKLSNLTYFVVGAGAIGREYVKNLSMMGVGSGERGKIILTDHSRSTPAHSVNPRFLSRSYEEQRFKCQDFEEFIKKINPEIKLVLHLNRVGLATEQEYDDNFYSSLNGVANASDNVDTTLYLGQRCLHYRLPLIESSSLDTKGNARIIVPFLSSAATPDPLEKSILTSTFKFFPNDVEHTLQWARDEFLNLFNGSVKVGIRYIIDFGYIQKTLQSSNKHALAVLKSLKRVLVDERVKSFEECVVWARLHWEKQYANQIKQLLHNFPPDAVTTSGAFFWSEPRRCPKPLEFDLENSLHLDYIVAAANLRAFVYCLQINLNREFIAKIAENVSVPQSVPNSCPIAGYEEGTEEEIVEASVLIEHLKCLPRPTELSIRPIELEDHGNFTLDFIVAASNLRAENYGITPANRARSKLILGKTKSVVKLTSRLASGLSCLEIYKLVQGHRKLESYRNSFFDFAIPVFHQSMPSPFKNTEFQ